MKKLRYYAPYWIAALVLIALAALLLSYFGGIVPFSELPELASELENEHYFIREDGVVMKQVGGTEVSSVLMEYDGKLKDQFRLIGSFKPRDLSEMLPHEYAALISSGKIYVCQDGSVYAHRNEVNRGGKEYTIRVCPPSELPADAKVNPELSIGLNFQDIISADVPAKDTDSKVMCYISVKLKDGWYTISKGASTNKTVYKDNSTHHTMYIRFTDLHQGEYRLELCINDEEWSYKNFTLTNTGSNYYTLTH